MGKLVVIEGLDGSGKATQTALLAENLRTGAVKQGETKVRAVSFPCYDSDSSALVRMYLGGAFGAKPGDVNAYAASAFYAVDRYASYKTDWGGFYREGGLVLADRYTTSNAVHQCCKLPEEQRAAYLAWLEDFEYAKLAIPKPDLVLYLDVDPRVSDELLKKRYAAGERAAGEDIHEQDRAYQEHCRQVALWCAGQLGWRVVRCSREGAMRPAQEIAQEILSAVQNMLM